MSHLETRISTLQTIFDRWLNDDNEHLLRAVDQTVTEGYFSFPDVQFALKVLKESLSEEALFQWVEESGISDEYDASGQNALCLHAGNLPLVGFQDALAVLLSGARYTGKISRKDPYLLPTFLNEVKQTEIWSNIDVQWSHRLEDFEGMRNHRILFAGSEQSVPAVKEKLRKLNMAQDDTDYLIRTAHFSMAYIDRKQEADLQALTEAILRYGGKGCRSVAIVVAPFSFDSVKEDLKKSTQTFWNEYPQQAKPRMKLRHRFAYNEAIGRSQLWLKDFLFQEDGLELDQDFICYWIEAGQEKVVSLSKEFSRKLQSVYVTRPELQLPELDKRLEPEPLSQAQQPPIYWKPDGTDIINWLCNERV